MPAYFYDRAAACPSKALRSEPDALAAAAVSISTTETADFPDVKKLLNFRTPALRNILLLTDSFS
jgi:hypothetical protein